VKWYAHAGSGFQIRPYGHAMPHSLVSQSAGSLEPAVYLAAGTIVLLTVGLAVLMIARRRLVPGDRPGPGKPADEPLDAWTESARRAAPLPPDGDPD